MKKVFVRGPILSRSGYGEHARFLMRSLRKYEGRLFDIYAHSTNWGHTGWEIEDDEERQWLDNIFKKTQEYAAKEGKFDLSLQVTIPYEWEKLADINVGKSLQSHSIQKLYMKTQHTTQPIIQQEKSLSPNATLRLKLSIIQFVMLNQKI